MNFLGSLDAEVGNAGDHISYLHHVRQQADETIYEEALNAILRASMHISAKQESVF